MKNTSFISIIPRLWRGLPPLMVSTIVSPVLAEAGLDLAAYYHLRDCFVDPADFDWMSPGGRRFMAHWWNTMPQYSALFDHHGRVRPAYYAFRFLGQLEGPRFAVDGERDGVRAMAGEGDGYMHVLVWRYGDDGPDELEARLQVLGLENRNSRVVKLDPTAQVNNIQVVHFGRSEDLKDFPLMLDAWDVRWIEIE